MKPSATKCIMKSDRIGTGHGLQLHFCEQLLSSYIQEMDRLIWGDDCKKWVTDVRFFSLPGTFANLYAEDEKSTQEKNQWRRMKSEWFSLITFPTLPTRFRTGAGRRGETERLMGTEQGPVIFQKLWLSATLTPRWEPDPWRTASAISSDTHMHTQIQTHNWPAHRGRTDNLTSRETHMQPCRKTGWHADSQ